MRLWPGDHYANPWLLGMVRLFLTFPLLSESERQLIQDARLTVEELRIMQEQVSRSSDLELEEWQESLASLAVLESDYAKAMAALEPLFQNGRVTGPQAALLKSELAIGVKKDPEDPAAPGMLHP